MKLAIFDLDNTLLRGDSDAEWGRYLVDIGVRDAATSGEKNEYFYQQYKQGTLNIQEFLRFQLAIFAEYPRAQLDAWHADYMQTRVLPMITLSARALVEEHRAAGHTLMIITATNRFVTAPIAEEFNIPHLIACELETDSKGQFTGLPTGTPSFQNGKITRLETWLSEHNLTWQDLSESWFYSDSHNDLPLMQRVQHPIAVNPDSTLLQTAKEQAWKIMQLD